MGKLGLHIQKEVCLKASQEDPEGEGVDSMVASAGWDGQARGRLCDAGEEVVSLCPGNKGA